MNRSLALALPFALALACAACEHGVDAIGTIRVPPAVQRLFSARAPGEVVFEAVVPNVGTLGERVGVLCAPGDEDRVLSLKSFDFGCAIPGNAHVRAWAARTSAATPSCTLMDLASTPKTSAVAPHLADAEQEIPVDVSGFGNGCKDGTVMIDLTLQPSMAIP